jgi:hypothetical protein
MKQLQANWTDSHKMLRIVFSEPVFLPFVGFLAGTILRCIQLAFPLATRTQCFRNYQKGADPCL